MPKSSNPQIKVIGTIDRSSLNRVPLQGKSGLNFQLLSMKVRYGEQDKPIIFDFGNISNHSEASISGTSHFSLIIGRNGVGKSMMLRALIDFFVESHKEFDGTYRKNKPLVEVLEVQYLLNDSFYTITRNGSSKFFYECNGLKSTLTHMSFPLVISSTMGMFDKFPVNSPLSFGRQTRYSVPYYRYVGPKVSGNMYSSKTNVLMSTLYWLKDLSSREQISQIASLLQFLGYHERISIEFATKVRGIDKQTPIYDKVMFDANTQKFYSMHTPGEKYFIDVSFRDTTIKELKSLQCKQLYGLKQANMLSSCRICLYRDGQKIDCEQLSSGEFNMLTIVLNAILSPFKSGILLLLDEPEISQHPNWQMDILSNLNNALSGCKCHVLVSTHSHFLVSDLPMDRSDVFCMKRTEEDKLEAFRLDHDTYGWSSEEVLLKVFDIPTDRNRYLAEIVGQLMTAIAQNSISPNEVRVQLKYLERVSNNLSDVDPLKKVIGSIINEFNS